jgi:Transposase IS4
MRMRIRVRIFTFTSLEAHIELTMPPKRIQRAQVKQAHSELASEFDSGFIGPTPRFLPLDVPTRGGQTSLPPHIELTDPLALFNLFIGNEQLTQWCIWTNEYAKHAIEASQAPIAPHTRDHDWHTIEINEMRIIIAIIIAQGLYPLPNYTEYWEGGEHSHAHYEFTKHISLRRYQHIWRYLRPFAPYETPEAPTASKSASKSSPQSHEYIKMQRISEDLMRSSQRYWLHGSELCIDESMIGFQGRSAHKVVLKNKPIQEGFKLWILYDSGYAILWLFYTPKQPTFNMNEQNLTLASHYYLSNTEKVIFNLALQLQKRCIIHLYVDNLFTSARLAYALRMYSIGLTGVCKAGIRTPTRVRESELIKSHLRPSIEWFAPSETESKVIHIGFTDQKYVII